MNVRYHEVKGPLGVFGWIWRILMAVWQCLMVAWFGRAVYVGYSDLLFAEDIGMVGDIADGFAFALIALVWVAGTILLGLFVALTRRTRALVPFDE